MTDRTTLATVEMRPVAPRKRRRAETLTKGARVGGWRVEAELGRGGMATVYAVVHTKHGKRAALKLAHRDVGPEKLPADSFVREARIVNMVDHPCVADVFATGTFDGRPYVVMDRITGPTLSELARSRRIARNDALAVLAELCEVLTAAHAVGVVHRDLKLANVIALDSPCPAGRRIKLIDWGVAHLASEPDPLTGMIAGTLTYVAPEQIRGEVVTAKTDVYSLGVLAYELLLGDPPFSAAEDLELLRQHLREPPPDPRLSWPECPDALAALLVAMLAKQPADRPSIAVVAEVIASVRDELAEPRLAVAPPPAARPEAQPPTQPPTQERRRWLSTSLALLALVIALIAWTRYSSPASRSGSPSDDRYGPNLAISPSSTRMAAASLAQ